MANMVSFLTDLENAIGAAQSGEKQKQFVADVLKLKNGYSTEKQVIDDLEKWKYTVRRYNIVNHSYVEYGHAHIERHGC